MDEEELKRELQRRDLYWHQWHHANDARLQQEHDKYWVSVYRHVGRELIKHADDFGIINK